MRDTLLIWPRWRDPEDAPEGAEDKEPAKCLDCGEHYDADAPCCPCHEPPF